jgi:hypothetical protein
MKKSFIVFLLVAVTVSLYCGGDGGNTITSPVFNDPDRPSVNKDLLVGTWKLGSLKTIFNDGRLIEELITFAQTLVLNNDLTFNIENQAGPVEFEHLDGQWTSLSSTMQLLFIDNGSIFLIDDYEYTVTESLLELTLLSDTSADGSLLLTYNKV